MLYQPLAGFFCWPDIVPAATLNFMAQNLAYWLGYACSADDAAAQRDSAASDFFTRPEYSGTVFILPCST